MRLSFLPDSVKESLSNLNINYLTEIRLRRGQPVIIEYKGEYKYINRTGLAKSCVGLIYTEELDSIVLSATDGCVYNYTEQMKNGFITVDHGVRIGIAGEYVTQGGCVQAIKNITSLNIRIPHIIRGCADFIVENVLLDGLHSTMLYSKPGLGKTTALRDIACHLGQGKRYNVLVFDERNEIAAIDGSGNGYDLGSGVDVIRCGDKKSAIASAVRAMKPQVIITDELYGDGDMQAVRYAADCGICIIASSHVCNRDILKKMPFEFYVNLVGIGVRPVIYDKNFNTYCGDGAYDVDRGVSFG